MEESEVENLAQGRVWSGTDALENGLIDDFGGLQEALDRVAEEAGLTSYSKVSYPKWEPSFERLMSGVLPNAKSPAILQWLWPEITKFPKKIGFKNPGQLLQMELPYTLKID
jgi:protease-4